jgi:pantoate--beta-alanine ligase
MQDLKIFKQISAIKNFVKEAKKLNKIIAFVPTMGSLHRGHITLINNAKKNADIVIVSIFVNKAQFNDIKDYELYPQNLESDIKMLEEANVDALFYPSTSEIYDENFSFKIIPTAMVDCLCAKDRVGHFDGVALIITKLFNIVNPHFAYFGEKDFQQLAIIKKLVKDLNFDLEIFGVETVRESSGLAMSSRNQRLSKVGKIKASMLYKILNEIKINPQIIEEKKRELLANGFEKIDYLEIRNEDNLKLNMNLFSSQKRRIFIAVYLEGVRLIDNLSLNLI